MANLPISGLTASASNLASTDLAPVVQTVGVGPVKMTGLQLAGGLLGSTTFNGSTVTTSSPVLNLTQTWNAGAVTFTGLKFNAATGSNANSATASMLLDLQLEAASKFSVTKFGVVTAANRFEAQGIAICYNGLASVIGWSGDTFLQRAGTATLQLGAADVDGSPVPQLFQVQSVTATTTSNNVAGANFTINGSRGSGTGAGGSIIFQVAPASGVSGNSRNAYSTALTLNSSQQALFAAGTKALPSVTFSGNTAGLYSRVSGYITLTDGTREFCQLSAVASLFSGYIGLKNGAADYSAQSADVFMYCDGAANTLALKNAGNAQIFRVYSTTASSGSYGIISAGVQPDGLTAQADTLYIGSAGLGAAMTKLALVQNGTTRLYVDANGNLNTSSATAYSFGSGIRTVEINGSTSGFNTAQGALTFNSKTGSNGANAIYCAGGAMSFYAGSTTFAAMTEYLILSTTGLLQFQGTSSSFPALKRSSATLQVRLADDTAFAPLSCGNTTASGTALDVSGTGAASIFNVVNTTTGTLLSVVNSSSSTIFSVNDAAATGVQVAGISFGLTGNISAAAWTTSGIRYRNVSATLTDTSSSGTVATAYTDVFGGNTIAASSSTTYTNYATFRLAGPTAGTNVTFTNSWALSLGGSLVMDDATNIAFGTTTGTKIGTSTSQKIGFWNAAPIAQPTTGVAAATVAATGTGDVVAASTTFDGYTIPQIVKAMRNAGLLA